MSYRLIYYRSHVVQNIYTIVNTDPHTERGSHCLDIRITPRSSSAYYFESYGIIPLVPSIQAFLKRNCTTWEYNRRQLQGLSSDVWSVLLSSLSSCTRVTPLSNSTRSSPTVAMQTDRWRRCSRPNLGPPCCVAAGVNAAAAAYKRYVLSKILSF